MYVYFCEEDYMLNCCCILYVKTADNKNSIVVI